MMRLRLSFLSAFGGFSARLAHLLLVMVLLFSVSSQNRAQATSADEYDIRAAMLFNLPKFIEWRAGKHDAAHPEVVICILGSDPIVQAAERYLQTRKGGEKPALLRQLSSFEGAKSCNILYVGMNERRLVERSGDELAKEGVLVASERFNVDSPGQVIGLPSVDEHIHIDVNLGTAQRTGLTISSKLLRLATVTQ